MPMASLTRADSCDPFHSTTVATCTPMPTTLGLTSRDVGSCSVGQSKQLLEARREDSVRDSAGRPDDIERGQGVVDDGRQGSGMTDRGDAADSLASGGVDEISVGPL